LRLATEPELVTPFFLRNFMSLPVAWELEAPVTVGQPCASLPYRAAVMPSSTIWATAAGSTGWPMMYPNAQELNNA